MRSLKHTLTAAAIAMAALAAHMPQATAAGIEVHQPWTRATAPGARTGAGYMLLRNSGATADRLIGGSTPAAARVEIHEVVTVAEGALRMQPLANGLLVPAGGDVTLKPGGYHVMLINPTAPFVAGTTVPLTLTFEKAGEVAVQLRVEAATFGGAPQHGHGGSP